jgi:Glycosyl hydrolase family 47
MRAEFELTANAVRQIGFAKTDEQTLNTVETAIRYLGGFLAAYDLSGCEYYNNLRGRPESSAGPPLYWDHTPKDVCLPIKPRG